MIDLTSRSIDEVNTLIQKYANVLELTKQHEYIPYLAVVYENGIKHIKENYKDLPIDWKSWSILQLKYQFIKGNVKKEADISKIIDEFIKHYNEEYKKFIDNTAVYSDNYDRDFSFVWRYIQKNR